MSIFNTEYTCQQIHTWFTEAKKIFFIGIGGISMSSIARFVALCGKRVYGYDRERTSITEALEKTATVKYYSTPDNVTNMDMVVYTNAIDESCLEYRQAKRLKIPTLSRANFLGYIISLHEYKIGIAGTHGKSTTTAMLSHIFDYACKNPTCFCGAEMITFNSPCRLGGGREYCIFEGCEYANSFLSLPTTDAAVLNIDYDHPDFFPSLEKTQDSFKKFIKNASRVYINCDDEGSKCLCHRNVITFGFSKNSQYRAEMLKKEKINTGVAFSVYKQGKYLTSCHLPLYGQHIVYDALCSLAIAHTHGISPQVISKALSTFKGSHRRLEFIKKSDTGADILEDYAHHPTEIRFSLSALKEKGYNNILCIFQPHTFSRTYYLYSQFTNAFCDTERLIVYPVFSAREENIYELSEEAFAHDCGGEYISSLEEIASIIKEYKGECIVILGAGDLAEKLKRFI